MIESSTNLVQDLRQELTKSAHSLKVKSSKIENGDIHQKAQYLTHHCSIQTYFLRMSWSNKLRFVELLLNKIKNVDSLKLLVNTLYGLSGKIASYTKVMVDTNFVYDRIINDHNRMLEDNELEALMRRDVKWYSQLSEKEQEACLISLLRFGGGAIRQFVYQMARRLYNRRVREAEMKKVNHVDVVDKEAVLDEEQKEIKDILPSYQRDVNNPLHVECERLTKLWNETIERYGKEIGYLDDKVEKSAKPVGKKTKKKKEKEKKKSKKSKASKEKDDEADWVQLMPIWIVKKIFGYLDRKTLIKAKKVNQYWAWAIENLFQDWKARKLLDNSIAKMKKSIDFNFIDDSLILRAEEAPKRVSFVEKRMKKLMQRLAILEELRYCNYPLNNNCLLTDAVQERSEEYVDPIHDLEMFPRVALFEKCLYKTPSLICKDLNLIYDEKLWIYPDDMLSLSSRMSASLFSSMNLSCFSSFSLV